MICYGSAYKSSFDFNSKLLKLKDSVLSPLWAAASNREPSYKFPYKSKGMLGGKAMTYVCGMLQSKILR